MLVGACLMMEEKQLDFNRPLISVRRPTKTSESESKTRCFDSVTNKVPPSPPVFKSDIKSGPVRNPGTVPFQWEHKPGKPKDETKSDPKGFVEPHFVPKLPPGRLTNARADQHTKTVGNNVEDAKTYSSRYDDDTYLDATDTLSRSESFFFNCSNVSGVSGVDGLGMLVEPFGTLSSDRQTQDLMMGRFLPAAKALTSETPPFLAKKPPKPESCLRSSFGLLNPGPSGRMQAQRAVSVRRMRSKYQDSITCHENQNKQTNESVHEDKRMLKLNDSVAQGPSQGETLLVSSIPQGKGKLEKTCTDSRTKTSKNFGELLASHDNTWEPSSETPVAEKTLYVDTIHSVDKKVQEETTKQSLLKEYPSPDIVGVEDVQNLIRTGEETISQPKSTEQMDANIDEEFIELSIKKVEECLDLAMVALPDTNVVVEATNVESWRLLHRSSYHIIPPPPLPKGPSDSWLKRTLPTIPSKNNSFTWLQSLGTDDNHFTKIQANPKWETMVKTSNTQQGFVCFSKETLNPIPEA